MSVSSKYADQPARPRSMVSIFAVQSLESVIVMQWPSNLVCTCERAPCIWNMLFPMCEVHVIEYSNYPYLHFQATW